MLFTEEISELKEHTNFWVDLANDIYPNLYMSYPKIEWDLRGGTAGQAWYGIHKVRYNSHLYRNNRKDFIENTIPHEVAHLVAHRLHQGRRIMPHGYEWKRVMAAFKVPSDRCHSYDVSECKRRQKRYLYKSVCGKTFKLSQTLHNKILRGQQRWCLCCKRGVEYVGECV